MRRSVAAVSGFLLVLLLAGCVRPTPTAEKPTPTPTLVVRTPLVISEVMAGATGDNNYEFIELYNATEEPFDLQGYRLLYRLSPEAEEVLVYAWDEPSIVPPHGHFLLVRSGVDVGTVPDAEFDQPLNTRFGSLILLDPTGGVADRVGWGDKPELAEGTPAPSLENDRSLERRPGGEAGSGQDTDDNGADFALNDDPSPQNTGSPPTPAEAQRLEVALSAPPVAEPGSTFEYEVTVTNRTGGTVHEVELAFTVPVSLTVLSASEGGVVEGSVVRWTLPELADGETAARTVTVEAPLTYLTALAREATARAADWPRPAFAPPVRTRIRGGILPIAAARRLMGQRVTVEGVATMYTGGYYAGGGNAKFYLEDGTGGIQIQCFDENGEPPTVSIGDRVRVSGEVGIYRNSLQIVPTFNPVDVVILEHAEPPSPLGMTIGEALRDPTVPGRLVAVTGEATRIEESTYSYQIDLSDEMGNVLLVYVDKLTGLDLTVEGMDVGHRYTVVGIADMYDQQLELKPRISADIVEVFPPVLRVAGDAPVNALPGAFLPYTLTVYNHTDGPFTGVTITAALPLENATLAGVGEGGIAAEGEVRWTIPSLSPGAATSVHLTVTVTGGSGVVSLPSYAAWASEWPTHETDLPLLTFIGETVPIWAVQGPGFASPYKLKSLTTEGVVTGLFPELGGFWIQSLTPDDDPATSEGLFVYVGEEPVEVAVGDRVRVRGRVRERGAQTELHIGAPEDVEVLSEGLPTPQPVPVDPPVEDEEAVAYFEPLEGMLVSLPGPAVAVGPVNQYGEYALVLAERGVDRVLHGDPTGFLIRVDDGSLIRHEDGSTLPYFVRTGDQVVDLVGPLAYTFGNYKIEPLATPTVVTAPVPPLPQLPEPGPDEFSIATFNVENLFDYRDPHPVSDPPKPSRRQYEWRLDRLAAAIRALGAPIIVGVQEIEGSNVLEDLAARPEIADYHYHGFWIDGPGGRDVGFLVRGDRAEVVGVGQYQAPEGLFSRPPLMITATVRTESAGEITVYAIVNHFISKAGGEALTEPRRVREAEWNAHLVDQILEHDPDAYVVVLGDLNDYYDSAPLRALVEGSTPGGRLVHALAGVEREERYSFIYQGVSQLLDHILVTPSLAEHMEWATPLHINADYPLPRPETPDPHRCSDHDPVVAMFRLGP